MGNDSENVEEDMHTWAHPCLGYLTNLLLFSLYSRSTTTNIESNAHKSFQQTFAQSKCITIVAIQCLEKVKIPAQQSTPFNLVHKVPTPSLRPVC